MNAMRFTLVAAILMVAVSAPAQNHRGPSTPREGANTSRRADDHRESDRARSREHSAPRVEIEPRYRSHGHGSSRSRGFRFPEVRFPLPLPIPVPAPRGHWETVTETVLVEAGHWHEEVVPPTYGWVYDHCGHRVWGVVDPGGCRTVWCPPRYENRCRRVWVTC